MRSIFVSHWSIITSMTFLHQIVLKILSKITGLQNKVINLHIFYEVNLCVTLIHYHKYDIPPSNSLQDIKQSNWTAKYRSLTCIYFIRLIFVSHWSIVPSMTFLHQIIFKILSKVTGPQNTGHWFVSHWSIIPSMTFLHQIAFTILSKITGPWNIGHWPSYILSDQSLCHNDPISQVWHSAIK